MSATTITMSDFARNYKEAKTKDEEVLIILDIIKQSQIENKKEILTEIKHDDLVTKQYLDLRIESIQKEIVTAKNAMLWAMIGICGIWVPAIVGVITTVILKHA